MARWPTVALATLLIATLSGCMQGDADVESNPDSSDSSNDPLAGNQTDGGVPTIPAPQSTALESISFTASSCNAVVTLSIDEYGAIEHFLPAGFTPADVLTLLKLQDQLFTGQGAIGPIYVQCENNSYNGNPLGLSLVGTLVYTPIIEGIEESWVDGYQDFITVSDPEIADLFEQFGWDVERDVEVAISVMYDYDTFDYQSMESAVPGATFAQAKATRSGVDLGSGAVVGSAIYHTSNGDERIVDSESGSTDFLRFWFDTPDGLSYIENLVSENGKSGQATCEYKGRFAESLGRTLCEEGNAIGLIIPNFEFETTLVRLDGVHA